MKILTKEEAIQLSELCDGLQREDPNSLYQAEGRQFYYGFVLFLYANDFEIKEK